MRISGRYEDDDGDGLISSMYASPSRRGVVVVVSRLSGVGAYWGGRFGEGVMDW